MILMEFDGNYGGFMDFHGDFMAKWWYVTGYEWEYNIAIQSRGNLTPKQLEKNTVKQR